VLTSFPFFFPPSFFGYLPYHVEWFCPLSSRFAPERKEALSLPPFFSFLPRAPPPLLSGNGNAPFFPLLSPPPEQVRVRDLVFFFFFCSFVGQPDPHTLSFLCFFSLFCAPFFRPSIADTRPYANLLFTAVSHLPPPSPTGNCQVRVFSPPPPLFSFFPPHHPAFFPPPSTPPDHKLPSFYCASHCPPFSPLHFLSLLQWSGIRMPASRFPFSFLSISIEPGGRTR